MSRKRTSISYVIRDGHEPLHRGGVNALIIAEPPADCLFTACRDSVIRSWNYKSKSTINLIDTYEHHSDWVNSIFYTPRHDLLFSGSSDTGVKIWDASKGFVMSSLRTHRDYVKRLSYAVEKDIFASGGLDKKIYVWDVCTLKCLTTNNNTVTTAICEGHKNSIYSLSINPSGTLLVSGGTENFIRMWDPRSCTKVGKLKGHMENVRALVLSPDGTQLISGSTDGSVKLWSIGQQRCVATFRNHNQGVWAIAVNDSWTKFYSGGRESTLVESDLKSSESNLLFKEAGSILDVVCDGTALWVGTTQTSVNKWNLPATKSQHCMELKKPLIDTPSAVIEGGEGLKKAYILSDKQHVICTDSRNNGFLYNVLSAKLVKELGKVDVKTEIESRNKQEYIPNWFTADVKTGMLSIHLDESDCYSAWVCVRDDTDPNDSKINYGGLIIQALLQNWVCGEGQSGLEEPDSRSLYSKQCALPPHTPFALIEGSDGCGRTLFRIKVNETGNPNDSRILDELVPAWVYDLRVKNEMPKFTKIAFYIEPYAEEPPPKSREGRLSANDFLAVSKVIEYVSDKILGPQEGPNPVPHEIVIFCNKHRLEPKIDLRTVKHTIWKSGSDLRLMYLLT